MKNKERKNRKNRILRIIGKVLLTLVVTFLLLILFIRSKWGQDIIVNKVVSYIAEKTNTKVEIDKLYITFGGNVMLDGLYLEDMKGDTLVYSKSIEANMPLWSIINGNGIGVDVDDVEWDGLTLNIVRKDTIKGYNFQFLIDAFASENPPTVTQDTTNASLNIIIGSVDLNDFDITFNDAVLGIDSRFLIGNLSLAMDKTDIENMDFKASEINLSKSKIKYIQSPVLQISNEESTVLPFLSVDKLIIDDVIADYRSLADNSNYHLSIAQLETEIPKIDLQQNIIDVVRFDLKDSKIVLKTKTIDKTENESDKDTLQITQKFEWPNFKINIDDINLNNNNFSYQKNNAIAQNAIFNNNAIILSNLSLKGENIFLRDKNARLRIDNFSFKEASGIHLKQFALDADISDNLLNISKINMLLNNNKLNGNAKLNYENLASFIKEPDKAAISINIPNFQIDVNDVYRFQPKLKQNKILTSLSKNYLKGNVEASGILSSIKIPDARVQWGSKTKLHLNGKIENVTNIDKLQFNIPQFTAQTNEQSLLQFVNEDSLGISLPSLISLKGNAKGSLKDVVAKAQLNTSQGNINLDGHFNNNNLLAFDAMLKIDNYKIGKLLKNNTLRELTLSINTEGKGKNINNLDAEVLATIEKFGLNDYEIKDLKIQGNFINGKGNVESDYKDENLNLNLLADIILDSAATQASVNLNIIGADLQALGIVQRNIKTGFKLNADFKGNSEKFNMDAKVEDGVVVYNSNTYLLGGLSLRAFVDKDTTSATLKNKLLDFELHSNASPEKFTKSLQRHVSSYFYRDIEVPDSIKNPVNLELKGKISQSSILNEVFLVNLKDLDTVDVSIDFKEKSRKLKANITAPHINYAGSELDSLVFSMDTDIDKFEFDFGFKEINSGPLSIKKTSIKGNQLNNELKLDFVSFFNEEKLINIESNITGNRDSLKFHIFNDNLILNKNKWETPTTNAIFITKGKLQFNDFNFSRNGESVAVTDAVSDSGKDRIDINFNDFKLNKILNYLNPESQLASGVLNGEFSIENPFEDVGVVADLAINKLKVLDVDLGVLTLDTKSDANNNYSFNSTLKEGEVDLNLDGNYKASVDNPQINLDLLINNFNMKALEGFTSGEVSNGTGSFSGNFNMVGNFNDPTYSGQLNFKNADFEITTLNQQFTLTNEILNIDNQGFSMNNFTIKDENNNTFALMGSIGTESFINPTFNLDIKADNFQVINATKEDNNLVYGKASFDVEGKLTGDLQIPKLNATLTVNSNTDIFYVMPTAAVSMEQRDGVVVFVNRENPDAILTRTEEKTAIITGFDINSKLKISEGAKVTVIIDEETNDNFQVSGNGDFNFKMSPNGLLNLTGVYDISSGHYEMNLYNLVNRKFELTPQSKISWFGDPFDAKLDVTATYKLDASASPLMASQVSGSDPSVKNKFRQILPFLVYLNIDGELMQPKISFQLDMPEDEQGAVGGQVYGRVQQINQQENELNQQVFSLLVLNRFYPQPGSDGSNGGFASIARDNLNDALSDQLNVFSDKLLGDTGIELDFGLDSYTDYQGNSPQQRTQLDIAAKKKLFNDRLIVSVGSEVDIEGSSSTNEPTPIIGNVSLEYLLTENGRYRLKGFRRNEFENVIDGQTIVSGIALIFTQEFNKFDELWKAILGGGEKKNKDEKESKSKEQNDKKE
ncbi:translocation/assembly module TamB domain-containing protein [Aureibaculum sp. 2210JD6-5]|uniref:translocation/assembly module TamB domain-containing protein n=1 Tax=Aureibaculum sp. 2210JD6-5 TaxID=3103957 RepID=UPI002AAE3C30|nr:translocation/assembly module TamB domain-containing protein [Aureibaculum sp. 2210JD6-5]MDY7394117.1 translocation/assembly module TamB domain-containing protein [Aureibaculum sp. 2210JD6-5]